MYLFTKNLNYLIDRFDITQKGLASYVDKAQSTVANWREEKTFPDVNEFIKIIQYFGLSADIVLFVDIQKGNLITDEHVKTFKRKGNLKGNRIGNLNEQKQLNYSAEEQPQSMIAEAQQAADWILLKKMEELGQDFDQLRSSVEKILSKVR